MEPDALLKLVSGFLSIPARIMTGKGLTGNFLFKHVNDQGEDQDKGEYHRVIHNSMVNTKTCMPKT